MKMGLMNKTLKIGLMSSRCKRSFFIQLIVNLESIFYILSEIAGFAASAQLATWAALAGQWPPTGSEPAISVIS